MADFASYLARAMGLAEQGARRVGEHFAPNADTWGAKGIAGVRSLFSGDTYQNELDRYNEAANPDPWASPDSRWGKSVVEDPRQKTPAARVSDMIRDPRGQAQAMAMAGAMAAPIAYHGSPHVFDKFSMDKIGTGEGAQAYGHGLYFTSNPKVAEGYRSGLTARSAEYKPGVDWQRARETLKQRLQEYADQQEEIHLTHGREWTTALDRARRARGQAEFMDNLTADDLPAWQTRDIANEYGVSADDILDRPSGSFHQVDLPDNLLDYDRGLSAQRPEVIQALEASRVLPPGVGRYLEISRQMDEIAGAPLPKGADAATENASRRARWDALNAERKAIDLSKGGTANFDPDVLDSFFFNRYTGQDVLRDAAPDPAVAAERLRKAGIPGHRYRGDSSGVENFVIYDDAQIKPLGRYGSLAEFMAAQVGRGSK